MPISTVRISLILTGSRALAHRSPAACCGLIKKEHFYPIGAEEPLEENSFLSLNWVIGDTSDMKRIMALQILDHALLRMQGAPLRQALIDAGLGRDVDSNFESDILQPFFSIVVSKSETARADDSCRL